MKKFIRELIIDYDNMAEAQDDLISQLLTILPRLRRKSL